MARNDPHGDKRLYRVTTTTPLAKAEGYAPESYVLWAWNAEHAHDRAYDRRECDSEIILSVAVVK